MAASSGHGLPFAAGYWRRMRAGRMHPRDVLAALALLVILIMLLASLWPQAFTAVDSRTAEPSVRLQPPSSQHVFGTDYLGRDVLARVIYGARLSLLPPVLVAAMAASIGTAAGLVAGYAAGWIDELVMRFTDVFLGIPGLILAMTIATALGPSVLVASLAIVVVWWPGYARLARSETQVARTMEYVEAARGIGAGGVRIVFQHIFPNIVSSLIVKLSLDIGTVLLVLSGLSFLGMGAQAPTPEWGLEVSAAGQYMFDSPWYLVAPSAAIFLAVFSMNVLGDAIREHLDPRLRA